MQPFDVCWERIARAHTHREAIAREWNSFIDKDPYIAHVYVDDDGAGAISIEVAEPIPRIISLEIGELLYQFRAALDACVYELACLNTGQRPPPHENKLEFPISATAEGFKSAGRKIQLLTDEQKFIVESVQPYNAPPHLNPAYIPLNFNRGLQILNDWARIDRHRTLHVMATQTSHIQPMLLVPAQTRLVEFAVLQDVFILKDECEIATFKIEGWQRGMHIKANPNLALDIAVDEVPAPCHHTDTLHQRFRCIEVAITTVIEGLAKTVGIARP